MEENNNSTSDKEQVVIDNNLKEIMRKAKDTPTLSEAEKKKLIEEINNNFDFDKLIQNLISEYDLDMDKYVIFTNGKEQLYYEDGEFFIISAIDSKKAKKKIKREEARNLYNEFYLMTVLNPILKQKQEKGKITKEQVKEIIIDREDINKEVKEVEIDTKATVKEEVKDQVKDKTEKQEITNIEDRLNKLKEKEKKIKEKRIVQEPKERN